LSGSLRKDDLARAYGGDEFTILLEGIATVEQVQPIVQRVQAVLREPISLNGREFLVGGSLGIAMGEPNLDSRR
jgi:GGDEF domain-containing protein